MRAEGKRPSKHPTTRPYYDTFLVPIAKTRHVHYRSLSFSREASWANTYMHTPSKDALVLSPALAPLETPVEVALVKVE